MKNLLLISSLMLALYNGTSNAKNSDNIEAKNCSEKECPNLNAPSNANNTGKQGSKFNDALLVEGLVKGGSLDPGQTGIQ